MSFKTVSYSILIQNYFPYPLRSWLMIVVSEEGFEPLPPCYQEAACQKNEKGLAV